MASSRRTSGKGDDSIPELTFFAAAKPGHEVIRRPSRSLAKEDEIMSVRRVKPPPPMLHEISDDQLQMFLDCNRDGLSDVMSAALGLATGLLIPSGEAVYSAIWADPVVPLGALHIIELIGTFVAFAVGATIAVVSRSRSSRAEVLAAELRARHNVIKQG